MTLIELIVVIFLIALFSTIIVANFPVIQRNFAISRAAYKLAQDLRSAEDLGLSGVKIKDSQGNVIQASGYGVYVDVFTSRTIYLIYADVKPSDTTLGNSKYDGNLTSTTLCSNVNQNTNGTRKIDCIIQIIDISKENPGAMLGGSLTGVNGTHTSINFSPPNPYVTIDGLDSSLLSNGVTIPLTLSSDAKITRSVNINTSGLIEIK